MNRRRNRVPRFGQDAGWVERSETHARLLGEEVETIERSETHARLRKTGARRRGAFSLLEVILALAILAGAIAVLGELSRLGMENARLARDMSYAILLCEGKLDEIAAGVTPAETEQGVPFEPLTDSSDPDWLYSIDVASMSDDGLLEIRVTVTQDLPMEKRPVEFSLVRWMVDPTIEPTDMTAVQTGSEGEGTGETP